MQPQSEAASRVVRVARRDRKVAIPPRKRGLLAPLAAQALGGYFRWVARTTQVETAQGFSARLAALSTHWGDRRQVFYYWNRDAFCLLLHEYCREGAYARGVPVLCDESFGADVTASLLAYVGRETRMLHWTEQVRRVSDLQAIVRGKESLALAVDGNGPYGEVRSSFARLIDRLDAVVVPVACRASRTSSIRMHTKFEFPRPRTRLAIAIGEPFIPKGDANGQLHLALEDASRAAEDVLAVSPRR